MTEIDLTVLTLADAVAQIKGGELSPVELVRACLARIEYLNPTLNAFLTVMGDEALEQARYAAEAIRRGEDWGVLHGVPVGVKDLIDVAGARTTAGSDFLRENVAKEDAFVVQQLRGAGAIILGKTHTHEFAIGATTVNPHYGPAHNPWNVDYSPGGSSGGSAAALAASLCLGALGTDTGGSVREPAALCGLTGLRPAIGRLNTQGVIPMTPSLDVVGPMTHTALDAALMMDALDPQSASGGSYLDHLTQPLDGLRVGLPVDDFFWLESNIQVVAAVRRAVDKLADLGLPTVEVGLPTIEEIRGISGVIALSEAAAYHKERLESEPERFGADVRARLEDGMTYRAVDYIRALGRMAEWQRELRALFAEEIDVLAMPTVPVNAHPISGSTGTEAVRQLLRFTYPFALSGLPALSIPCGFAEGFPIGLQLVALSEKTLLRVAHAYQRATDWHARRPVM
jgi:aspartyl-tRNA(Asn)/glutamyl-tRNA(Gln) amidotransferase subunit A